MPPSIFRTIYLEISNNFWCGFWVNRQLLQLLHCFCLLIIRLNVGSLAIFHFLHLPQNLTFEWWSQVYMRLHWTGDESWMFEIIAIILKLIMTTYSCYADCVETCRNLSGQELSHNSSSFCSSGTQILHLPMYLCDYSFLMMRWNHKWGLGWKALSYIIR